VPLRTSSGESGSDPLVNSLSLCGSIRVTQLILMPCVSSWWRGCCQYVLAGASAIKPVWPVRSPPWRAGRYPLHQIYRRPALPSVPALE
jgi:hypothetical protein